MSDAKKTREEMGTEFQKTWMDKLLGIQLFLESVMLEQEQCGRKFNSKQLLPVANEALKAEILAMSRHMNGPQLVVASEEPKTPLKPN